jgi:hypothetical protein
MCARFAGLDLNEVENIILAAQQQVMKAQENAFSFGERECCPIALRGACKGDGALDIRVSAPGNRCDDLARYRRANLDLGVRSGSDRYLGYKLREPNSLDRRRHH